jgi:putative isomerase
MNASPLTNALMPDTVSLLACLHKSANDLMRSPSGVLRHPFIVPGALYAQELWDWDSYWTTLGLLRLAKATGSLELRARTLRHGRGSLLNFFAHQAPCGGIPIMMRADNPDVFGCFNDEGIERNQAKPVFGQFALALTGELAGPLDEKATADFLSEILPGLDRFYAYWESRYTHPATGLLIWGSDVGIGVDNDPTTYARPQRSSANLLLNCLYYADLVAAETCALRIGEKTLAARWKTRAEKIADSIRTHMWDERDGFFYSLDVQCADHRAKLIPWAAPGLPLAWHALPLRIQLFTGFLPLWCGIATPAQAAALLRHATNTETFSAPGGIRTLSRRETMFTLAVSNNPSNWLGPVWILANYFVWKGLDRYGFTVEAAALATKTAALLEADVAAHGATHEYYDPETCSPLMNKGFLSWNYLVCEMLG